MCGGVCVHTTLGSVSHRKSPALPWPRPQHHLPPCSLSYSLYLRCLQDAHTCPPLALCSCTTPSTGSPGNVSLLSSRFFLSLRAQLRIFPFTKQPESPLKVSKPSTPPLSTTPSLVLPNIWSPPRLICPPGLDYELLETRVCL